MTRPDLREVHGAEPRGYDGFEGIVAPRASQSEPWWPKPTRAPEEAPNVVVILVDDMGFSDIEPFGSEIPTPGVQGVAEDGYRFTNFRVTPLCAPSRAALLTGANPHRAGFGMVPHLDPGYPGMRMSLPQQLPTLAETFRVNGYATFMVGKWHLTPEARMHDGAEKSSWPIQRGFDRYFGSLEGFTTLFHPHRIVRDNSPVSEDFEDDDYLTDRLTDEAISMIDAMRAGDGSKPFFLYFSHHAVHGPVQSKSEDIAKFKGAYEAGWDEMRRRRFARQKQLGLWPTQMELPEGSTGFDENLTWGELSEEAQTRFARHMEVYAGAVTGVDQSVARLTSHLKKTGEYENTIFVFLSDNGGTSEGGAEGTRSYFSKFVHEVKLPEGWVTDVDRPLADIGGPRVHGHYPQGWAHVSNTPYREYKGSVYEGGVHSPLIISWPRGLPRLTEDTGIRDRFAFVTDLAPTLIELAGVARPSALNGSPTLEADGKSIVPQLLNQDHDSDRGQYLALQAKRAFYRGRWKLVVPPGGASADQGAAASQLYDLVEDPLEQRDVAHEHPDLTAELAEEWRRAAWHNTVFPTLDSAEAHATVPSTLLELSQPVTLYPGSPTLERYRSARLTSMRSFDIEISAEETFGVGLLVSHGDQGGGYALWAEGGELCFSYNAYGVMHRMKVALPGETDQVKVRFTALPEVRWRVELLLGDHEVGRFELLPMLVGMAPFTGISVGLDGGGPVDWELYERHRRFKYVGDPFTVRYVPGQKAPYNGEIVRAIDDVSARLMD